MYRMPTHFGPSIGPRQGPRGRRYENRQTPHKTIYSVRYLTEAESLERLLPEGFGLREASVTVVATYIKEVEWLAGRGYNTLGVYCPVTYHRAGGAVDGSLLLVLWESLADPIITGRDDLGYPKLWCELPEPQVLEGVHICTASWLGFKFLELRIRGLTAMPEADYRSAESLRIADGVLVQKYVPRTGEWGRSDVSYVTMTPAGAGSATADEILHGDGTVEFLEGTWEELPTLIHIVDSLRELPVREYAGSTVVRQRGGTDYREQQAL